MTTLRWSPGLALTPAPDHAGWAIPLLQVADGVELGLGQQVATGIHGTCLRCDGLR